MHKIIDNLSSVSSRIEKEAILAKVIDDPIFQQGCVLAFDKTITFGVSEKTVCKYPGLSDDYDPEPFEAFGDWEWFSTLTDELADRELTGDAAKEAIQDFAANVTEEQWEGWYRRILVKDLKCGVSEKTINKVAKANGVDFKINTFDCMLAQDGSKYPKKVTGECVVEYKYDGVRVIAIVKQGVCTLYSRNGKELVNFPHINHEFEQLVKSMRGKGMTLDPAGLVFDGEVMSENFQELMKQVTRKSDVNTEDAYLALFDVLTLPEFQNGGCDLTILDRKRWLSNIIDEYDGEAIKMVAYQVVDIDDEVAYNSINKEALDKGMEGIMIKPIDGTYQCKRSYNWLKIKPFIEVTLTVDGFEEGTGKNKGGLGALMVSGQDDGKYFELNVGSGLTDQLRDDIWKNKSIVLGQLVEIRADAATLNQDSENDYVSGTVSEPIYSLRFPRFKTFRGFELGEKL